MMRHSWLLACAAVACASPSAAPQDADGMTTYASAHFTFSFTELDRATIAQTAAELEQAYPRIVADLGVTDMPRVRVWLYAGHAALARAVAPFVGSIPSWASGLATARDAIHMMSPNAAGASYATITTNLVHEVAHCASLARNATIGNNPRWWWESVATFEAGQRRDPKSLPYMMALQPPTFAMLNDLSNTAIYDVGYTIGEFVVARWGKAALANLVVSNADVSATLGISPTQFERDWFEWVREEYGIPPALHLPSVR